VTVKPNIDILYCDGCPGVREALERVRRVVAELSMDARVRTIEIRDQADAERARFLGSPSVHVDGRDVEPAEGTFALQCRLYPTGAPSAAAIRAALVGASGDPCR
jgi:hypothetical protein